MKPDSHISLPRRPSGFTVMEMLVSVTLLGVIVFGLYAMFSQTARALRQVTRQAEVFDGGRATMNLIAREMQEMVASGQDNVANAFAQEVSNLTQSRPGGGDQSNILQAIYFLTRQNDNWTGTGYRIDNLTSSGVGTLSRFTITNSTSAGVNGFFDMFKLALPDDFHLVAEGVIHFQMLPFDAAGRPYTNIVATNLTISATNVAFANNYLPAYVDLELGILEPQALKQFRTFTDTNMAQAFLTRQIGRVQLFRQRLQIRNHHEP